MKLVLLLTLELNRILSPANVFIYQHRRSAFSPLRFASIPCIFVTYRKVYKMHYLMKPGM
uniref:Uncharacterized protein n=1 Tax=Anguilla anguilla TaxID=7936 RepID=A0A0E9P686_ANGAN